MATRPERGDIQILDFENVREGDEILINDKRYTIYRFGVPADLYCGPITHRTRVRYLMKAFSC